MEKAVGWAKRSVPTTPFELKGGHGAMRLCHPTSCINSALEYIPRMEYIVFP
jgi:hypothetical protein